MIRAQGGDPDGAAAGRPDPPAVPRPGDGYLRRLDARAVGVAVVAPGRRPGPQGGPGVRQRRRRLPAQAGRPGRGRRAGPRAARRRRGPLRPARSPRWRAPSSRARAARAPAAGHRAHRLVAGGPPARRLGSAGVGERPSTGTAGGAIGQSTPGSAVPIASAVPVGPTGRSSRSFDRSAESGEEPSARRRSAERGDATVDSRATHGSPAWWRRRPTGSRRRSSSPTPTRRWSPRHAWLAPHFAGEGARSGCGCRRSSSRRAGRTVVVDPCVGNGRTRSVPCWTDQAWPFMERFRAAGFDPRRSTSWSTPTSTSTTSAGTCTGTATAGCRRSPAPATSTYAAELDSLRTDADADVPRLRAEVARPDLRRRPGRRGGGRRRPRRRAAVGAHAGPHAGPRVALAREAAAARPRDRRRRPSTRSRWPSPTSRSAATSTSTGPGPPAGRSSRTPATRASLVLGSHFPTRPGGRLAPDGDGWRFLPLAAEV